MRKYRISAASSARIEYGIELVAGLRAFPESAPFADGFEQVNDGLDAAHAARVTLRKPQLQRRARLRFANYHVDGVIRMVSRGAEIADGGRRGPIHDELFPDGVSPVVAPTGRGQIEPTRRLIERLEKSQRADLVPLRDEWLPRLAAAFAELEQAADEYRQARAAYVDAFRTEQALRAEHLEAVDRLVGQVRATFPRDRIKQDLVFPAVVTTRRRDGEVIDGDGDGGGDDGGATDGDGSGDGGAISPTDGASAGTVA